VTGESNLAISRFAFLSEAEDQTMRIGDETGGEEESIGAVSAHGISEVEIARLL
jgi:hypothetical protein